MATKDKLSELRGPVSSKTVLEEIDRFKAEDWKMTTVELRIPLMNSQVGEQRFFWRFIVRFKKDNDNAFVKVHDISIGGGDRSKVLYEVMIALGIECEQEAITTDQFRKEYASSVDCDETTGYCETLQLIWVASQDGEMQRMK